MATKKEVTTRVVSRSATVQVSDVTVDDIVAAAAEVGAPTTARVTTANTGYVPVEEGETSYPYTVTYSWSD